MAVSFMPDGHWFVFDAETGRTLAKGFKAKHYAVNWIGRQQASTPA